jgi:hypothetical protein
MKRGSHMFNRVDAFDSFIESSLLRTRVLISTSNYVRMTAGLHLRDILDYNNLKLVSVLCKIRLQMLAFISRPNGAAYRVAFLEERAHNPTGNKPIST